MTMPTTAIPTGDRGVLGRLKRRAPHNTAGDPGGPAAVGELTEIEELMEVEGLVGTADGERGVILAQRLSGERALPTTGRAVILSQTRLCRHVLVLGATGSGKTETVLRLAWTAAKATRAPVFYLDGKGDRDTARRFRALMADAGRHTRVFPIDPFDGWRGQPHEIQGRLMQIIDYAAEGPASWYRDIAKTTLRLVCEHPDGPPRSSGEALSRMDLHKLSDVHPHSSAARALTPGQVSQVRLRYEAFFGQTRGALDGTWAWEDTPAAYLLLDSLALREEASGLARFLFEDFAHYFSARKPREQFCLMVVDEFSALASTSGMAARVEQARGFNTGLVLAPQVVAGMGDEVEAARILGSVETVVCHRVNTPEEIIALAGTRKVIEYSTHYATEGPTGEGSARIQHQYKVDPNHVRSLAPGVAYIISRGRAMKAKITQAPMLTTELPEGTVGSSETVAITLAPAAATPGTAAPAASCEGPPDPLAAHTSRGTSGVLREETVATTPGAVPPGQARSEKGVQDLPF
jgi:hypothetical protein